VTPLGLTVLRRTATLAHGVPGLRVRLRHRGATLLEVLRPDDGGAAPAGRWVSPCTFRVAVGRAVRAARDGRTLVVLGLEPGEDPAVDVGAPRGRLLHGGVALVPTPGGCELAFATTVDADVVAAMDHGGLDARCHVDPVTEASLIVHASRTAPGTAAFADELDRLHGLVARCAVQELLDDEAAFLANVAPRAADQAADRPPQS
jgi:hypothetical protein